MGILTGVGSSRFRRVEGSHHPVPEDPGTLIPDPVEERTPDVRDANTGADVTDRLPYGFHLRTLHHLDGATGSSARRGIAAPRPRTMLGVEATETGDSMSLQSTFTALLENAKIRGAAPLPLETQTAVLEFAERTGDSTLLKSLSRYSHLHPTLLARLSPTAKTARDYARLPVTDLLNLAVRSDLDEADYRTILKRNSVKANRVLLLNDAAPLDVRVGAAEHLAGCVPWRSKDRFHQDLAKLRALSGEEGYAIQAAIARAARWPEWMLFAVSTAVYEPEDVRSWLTVLPELLDSGALPDRELTPVMRVLGAFPLPACVQGEVETWLLAVVADEGKSEYVRSAARESLNDLQSRAMNLPTRIKELEGCEDPEESALRYRSLRGLARGEYQRRLLAAAAANRHVPIDTFLWDFPVSLLRSAPSLLARRLEREGRIDVLDMLVEEYASYYTTPSEVLALEDQNGYVFGLLERLTGSGLPVPTWVWSHTAVRSDRGVLFACARYRELAGRCTEDPELLAAVHERISSSLGEDRVLWDTFRVLETEFEGTLEDLLTTVIGLR